MGGQNVVTFRSRMGGLWPLSEIWGDNVAPFRKDLDQFVEPLIQDAINRKQGKGDLGERGTLLDCLVDQTTGERLSMLSSSSYFTSMNRQRNNQG